MIYFGEVPSVNQLATIKQMVGPALAPRVNAQNSEALTGKELRAKESPDGPRINEYFARLVEDGKPPADGWFDRFSLFEYPAARVARFFADRKRPALGPNATMLSNGNLVLVHDRIAAASVRRPLNVQA